MINILRMVIGGEDWEVGPVGTWEVWEKGLVSVEQAKIGMVMYIDIHECDGSPASLWRAEDDGMIITEIDARKLSPDQRVSIVQPAVREEGREIFGEMIKDKVDSALFSIEMSDEEKE